MITFSIRSVTSLSIARGPGSPPPLNRPPQLEISDPTRDGRQPEGDPAIGQHRHDGYLDRYAEGGERADHSAVDAADTARQRQRVANHPYEVRHHDHRLRGR